MVRARTPSSTVLRVAPTETDLVGVRAPFPPPRRPPESRTRRGAVQGSVGVCVRGQRREKWDDGGSGGKWTGVDSGGANGTDGGMEREGV